MASSSANMHYDSSRVPLHQWRLLQTRMDEKLIEWMPLQPWTIEQGDQLTNELMEIVAEWETLQIFHQFVDWYRNANETWHAE
ncbi:uncharacterized protein KY384_003878 [Bacidia gigantensis]|uniref:uncharacterized protein n=1 Tax=Bacidia gigantensis TaxID=2732470 RepID=UPI001D049FD6|nr:uncharacterized protein KY384_003878 [Bacidia gigantensis]KAG8532237.1 hypothetical protein KY384_003878 [Bacidia gigantensis]